MFVVLITGSRTWEPQATVGTDIIRFQQIFGDDLVVRHGDCPEGVDRFARDYAYSFGVKQDPMPADWDQYGKRAGFIRNSAMVDKNPKPQICIAYITPCTKPNCKVVEPHGSHGATMCAELAEKAGIYVLYRRSYA